MKTNSSTLERTLPSTRRIPGLRVLFYDGHRIWAAKGLTIVSSTDLGTTWSFVARMCLSWQWRSAARLRPLQRLGRAEIYKLIPLGNVIVALGPGGVYSGTLESRVLRLVIRTPGSRPISLARNPMGDAFVGEYHSNMQRDPIRIHRLRGVSDRSVAYEFPSRTIRHVHGIFWDHWAECFWVLTGDDGDEAGIARATPDFSELTYVVRGSQDVRAVSLVIREEGLYFATDSENRSNAVCHLKRDGSGLQRLCSMENSSFHSGTFGNWMVFATVCEPSRSNDMARVHVWGSRDGTEWRELARHRKDRLPFQFQYGTVFFPDGETHRLPELVYTGVGLRGLDNATVFTPLGELQGVPWESRAG